MNNQYLVLYFSGTGNTRYVANKAAGIFNGPVFSIEEKQNYEKLIASSARVILCFPIYHSVAPIIMKEFVTRYKKVFSGKEIIIFSTQQCFSGDGAMSIVSCLPKTCRVIYAQHFNMPSNIGNIPLYSILTKGDIKKAVVRADKKLREAAEEIKKGIIRKRGASRFAKLLGKTQNFSEKKLYETKRNDVRVTKECIACGRCVRSCPAHNLTLESGVITSHNQCIFCYRCVNICPKKAITVLIHSKVRFQYYIADQIADIGK